LARQRRKITSGIPLEASDEAMFAKTQAHGARATCFFNNKGGVGKTTLVANLGAELSLNFGAKILVVDADPQCNLTQYVLGEEDALDIYSSNDPASVYSVIRPLSLGKGYGADLPVRRSDSFGFDIIVGDPRLALQEDLLANDWRDAKGGGMRGIRTTYVFADVVAKAKSMNYDFVFFDMGPSLGAINRSILLAMDFFVVPMSIDIFSTWAIKNIGSTVAVWQKELKTGISLAEDPSEIPSIDQARSLKFLGYVTQQHKERARDDTEAEAAAEAKGAPQDDQVDADTGEITALGDYFIPDGDREFAQPSNDAEHVKARRKRLVQAYEDINAGFPAEIEKNLGQFYDSKSMTPHLGNIRHLGSLAPMSQSQHTPMISVRGKGSYTQLRKQAREIYRGIASRYVENLTKL